ncbi:MAG: dihydropteroate synthase [Turicibacter sp.]
MALNYSNPLIMGILNVTPDSFSDGGKHSDIEKIIACAHQMVADGASIIDIGGESTRPGATIVSEEDEINRVIPVIERLSKEIDVPISIDTYKASVARAAVKAGATIINDIGGGCFDPSMPTVMAQSGAYVILMHNRKPDISGLNTMTVNTGDLTLYQDAISEVLEELQNSIDVVLKAGVSPEKIIIDPGIGFSKNYETNIILLKQLDKFQTLGYPVLLGVSRKGTIGYLLGGLETHERLEGTIAATCFAVNKGVQIIRVHDVLENARAAKVMNALVK